MALKNVLERKGPRKGESRVEFWRAKAEALSQNKPGENTPLTTPASVSESPKPEILSPTATAQDIQNLHQSVTWLTVVAGDLIKARRPNFPTTEAYRKWRADTTWAAIEDQVHLIAKYSKLVNVLTAWGVSVAIAYMPDAEAKVAANADAIFKIDFLDVARKAGNGAPVAVEAPKVE